MRVRIGLIVAAVSLAGVLSLLAAIRLVGQGEGEPVLGAVSDEENDTPAEPEATEDEMKAILLAGLEGQEVELLGANPRSYFDQNGVLRPYPASEGVPPTPPPGLRFDLPPADVREYLTRSRVADRRKRKNLSESQVRELQEAHTGWWKVRLEQTLAASRGEASAKRKVQLARHREAEIREANLRKSAEEMRKGMLREELVELLGEPTCAGDDWLKYSPDPGGLVYRPTGYFYCVLHVSLDDGNRVREWWWY